ncbi:conserved hypothetical protein [Thermotomaculum hydrothermale]|uniref:Lipoyl-binding domain-containing protein n=1 Tax=Thermotomaculum hydrothermale TaxID=981385 RepID=A0A7R6SXP8_9BACT|nr:conserved hypothetical protein [Thermotomaculum hydrothermale]
MEVSVKFGKNEFDANIEKRDNRFEVEFEGKKFIADFEPLSEKDGNLIVDGKSYHVIFTNNSVYVNGVHFDIETIDPLKKELLKSTMLEKDEGAIVTSMPGNVKRVLVQEGEEVEAGQPVVVLEAMKMENELEAPKSGVVKKVNVKENTPVEANTVLVEIE